MIEVDLLSEEVRGALYKRGWSDDDIRNMGAHKAFNEYCLWQGLIGYGPKLLAAWSDLTTCSDEFEDPE